MVTETGEPLRPPAQDFAAMEARWLVLRHEADERDAAHRAAEARAWKNDFQDLAARQDELQRAGLWIRGRLDYLGVLQQSRNELIHSTMVAWLLDPVGSHGLGLRVLEWLLTFCFDRHIEVDPASVRIARETPGKNCRADVVATSTDWRLVIENKVDAPESEYQCERLFQAFNGHPGSAFVLLSPKGGPPSSVRTEQAAAVWRPLSYAALGRVAETALASLPSEQRTTEGPSIVNDYIRTIKKEFAVGVFDDERLKFYLEQRERIEEWAEIRKEVNAAIRTYMCSLGPAFQELASRLGPEIEAYDRSDVGNYIVLRQTEWPLNADDRPLIGIGVGWSGQPLLSGQRVPYVGVRLSHSHGRWSELYTSFHASARANGIKVQKDDKHWPAYEYVDAGEPYWTDEALDAYRAKVIDEVEKSWGTFAGVIDQAVADWEPDQGHLTAMPTK